MRSILLDLSTYLPTSSFFCYYSIIFLQQHQHHQAPNIKHQAPNISINNNKKRRKMSQEPSRLTATEALQAFDSGNLTVEVYARSLLDRIQKRDEVVRAWEFLDRERVIEQAKALDQVPREQRGPLHGVAVGVKDVIYTKGMFLVSCVP